MLTIHHHTSSSLGDVGGDYCITISIPLKFLVEVSPIAIVYFWETALGCLLCPIWLICLMNAYGDPNWTRLARDE